MLRMTTAAIAVLGAAPMAAAGTDYPLTLTSCGHEVTIDKAPERVVSVGQGTTEILYMLGLADKVAGTALWINPVLPQVTGCPMREYSQSGHPISRSIAIATSIIAGNSKIIASKLQNASQPGCP